MKKISRRSGMAEMAGMAAMRPAKRWLAPLVAAVVSPLLLLSTACDSLVKEDVRSRFRGMTAEQYPDMCDVIMKGQTVDQLERSGTVARYNLGYCAEEGIGMAADGALAEKWYRMAAEANACRHAIVRLTPLIIRREGVAKDLPYITAVSWLKIAAEEGVGEAAFTVGKMLDVGQSYYRVGDSGRLETVMLPEKDWRASPPDPAMAEYYYGRALKLGVEEAEEPVGRSLGRRLNRVLKKGDRISRKERAEIQGLMDQGRVKALMAAALELEGLDTGDSLAEAAGIYGLVGDRLPLASLRLGRMMLEGKGVPRNAEEAKGKLTAAWDAGLASAGWDLGELAWAAARTAEDVDNAVEFYAAAMKEEDDAGGKAMLKLVGVVLGRTRPGEGKAGAASAVKSVPLDARKKLVERLLATMENMKERRPPEASVRAAYELGMAFLKGDAGEVVPRNEAKARQLAELAAKHGNTDAMLALATEFPERKADVGGDAAGDDRLTWLEAAANGGNGEAMYRLGQLLLNDRMAPKDQRSRGVKMLVDAAKAGHGPAAVLMANLYWNGVPRTLPPDRDGALWMAELAERVGMDGWQGVKFKAILAQRRGREDWKQARQEALKELRKAADRNDEDSCLTLGWYLEEGVEDLLPVNLDEAVRRFGQAADKGSKEGKRAYVRLVASEGNGRGAARWKKAEAWLKEMARTEGSRRALGMLADLYARRDSGVSASPRTVCGLYWMAVDVQAPVVEDKDGPLLTVEKRNGADDQDWIYAAAVCLARGDMGKGHLDRAVKLMESVDEVVHPDAPELARKWRLKQRLGTGRGN